MRSQSHQQPQKKQTWKKKAESILPNGLRRSLKRNSRRIAEATLVNKQHDEVTPGARLSRSVASELFRLFQQVGSDKRTIAEAEEFHQAINQEIISGLLSVEGITLDTALLIFRRHWTGILCEVLTMICCSQVADQSEAWQRYRFATFEEDRNKGVDIIGFSQQGKQPLQVIGRKKVNPAVQIFTLRQLRSNPQLRKQLQIESRNLGKIGRNIRTAQPPLVVIWGLQALQAVDGVVAINGSAGRATSLFQSDFSQVIELFSQALAPHRPNSTQ